MRITGEVVEERADLLVARYLVTATAPPEWGGGKFEVAWGEIVTFKDGLIARRECFDDADAALAELRRRTSPQFSNSA